MGGFHFLAMTGPFVWPVRSFKARTVLFLWPIHSFWLRTGPIIHRTVLLDRSMTVRFTKRMVSSGHWTVQGPFNDHSMTVSLRCNRSMTGQTVGRPFLLYPFRLFKARTVPLLWPVHLFWLRTGPLFGPLFGPVRSVLIPFFRPGDQKPPILS